MKESIKAQAVGALRQCAKEHEKDFTPTFNIRVSDLCNYIADYVEELQKENEERKAQIEKMKCCLNCEDCVLSEDNEIIGCANEREVSFGPCELWKFAGLN